MGKQNWEEYKITLTTMEPLHIGGTSHPLSDIDNPIVMLKGNIPAVPATTLKGAWRSQIERFLIGLLQGQGRLEDGEGAGLKPCIPASKLTPDEYQLCDTGQYKRKDVRGRKVHSPCTYVGGSDYICPACYLLGAQTLHGFVRVPFLLPAAGQTELDTLLYSIREDRAKGGAAKGSNRGWYVVEPGIVFKGNLEILQSDPIRSWEFGKKRTGLKYHWVDKWLDDATWTEAEIKAKLIKQCMESISVLGGYKSKGCGKVRITVDI
jgi:CRISPR/Cas system CSM-associated protein Csm3 (group 7 of RAMP superfamily)